MRLVRLQDRSTAWSYASETLQSGAFSPQGDRILCICSDELLWFAYPEGTLLQRLSLASAAQVWNYYTGPQVGFDRRATTVYFVGANACLYRWRIGENCDCILEDRPPARPAFTHEEYQVTSRDGRPLPVQRFIPPRPRSPAILYVHGGPGGAIDPDDPFMLRLLGEGIEFVCAAYRGSSGYGPEHEAANRGEYGRADVWDILAAGFDWKERAGENRPLIVAGYSYGGFLTFLALAQEEFPWAGGIAMWSVSGMHRMGLHQQRAFPTETDQLTLARVERSPLEQAGRIRLSLLIFHGALDTSATTEEMKSIQDSLLSRGGACELVVFEDDTHGLERHRAGNSLRPPGQPATVGRRDFEWKVVLLGVGFEGCVENGRALSRIPHLAAPNHDVRRRHLPLDLSRITIPLNANYLEEFLFATRILYSTAMDSGVFQDWRDNQEAAPALLPA